MDSTLYSLQTGNVLVFVEMPGTDIKTDYEVDKIVFEIAGAEILNKGGGVGTSKIRHPMRGREKRPKDALTHPDYPGVYVWFPT